MFDITGYNYVSPMWCGRYIDAQIITSDQRTTPSKNAVLILRRAHMDSPALETGLLTPDPREVPPPPRSSLNIGCAQKFYAAIDAAGKVLSEPQPVMAPRSQFSTADPAVSACHRSFLPVVSRRCMPHFRQLI